MSPRPEESPLQIIPHLTDRQLLERAVRTSHHAWEKASQASDDAREAKKAAGAANENTGKILRDVEAIARRLGVVEGQGRGSQAEIVEGLARVHLKDAEEEIVLRRKKWDTFFAFCRAGTKWLFVGGGGAGLYALCRYLLGY
jgi:hypothetical protein